MEPTRLLLSGDWHGDPEAMIHTLAQADRQKVDAVFQLGDFGIWTHQPENRKAIAALAAAARDIAPVYFIDGNHENFDDLELMLGPSDQAPFQAMSAYWDPKEDLSGLYFAPRGSTWTWQGVKFLALGGAVSIDKEWRLGIQKRSGVKVWWWQELITDEQEALAKSAGEVDVVLSHDCPFENLEILGLPSGYKVDPVSTRNRERIRKVLAATKPALQFHGHYHHKYSWTYEGKGFETRVQGLAHNDQLMLMTQVLDLRDVPTRSKTGS